MKITPEDYRVLEDGMMATLAAHDLRPCAVKHIGDAWELFHKAWNEKRIDGNVFYHKYNDSHFETEFRKMFK